MSPKKVLVCSIIALGWTVSASAQVPQPIQVNTQAGGATAVGSLIQKSASSKALSSLAGSGPIAVPEDFAKITLAPGFLLNIDVFDEPDMNISARVDKSGDIVLPLIGSLRVGGDTIDQARQAIEKQLISQQILLHPQVTVNIAEYAPYIVTVLGEVQTQGRVQLLAPHSLLDVLSMVGGETALAGNEVLLRHTKDEKTTTDNYKYGRGSAGSSIAKVMVHNGDTVIVPRAGIVYVLGAVNRPGGYLMQEDGKLDVAQALALAMGTSLQAKVKAIRVMHRNQDGSWTEFNVNYKNLFNGKQTPLQLQAQDIVYVPVSKAKAIFTSSASVIGETGSAAIYAVR